LAWCQLALVALAFAWWLSLLAPIVGIFSLASHKRKSHPLGWLISLIRRHKHQPLMEIGKPD
jgi:hypothetical protein